MASVRLTDKLLEEIQARALKGEVQEWYIKTVRSRVAVQVINPFTGEHEDRILNGDITLPDINLDDCMVPLYTDHDTKYFEQTNHILIKKGLLVPYNPEVEEERLVNAITDEELEEALNKKFFAVKALLDKFTSPVPVERLLRKAKEMNKTHGVITAIETRLAELQELEYGE